MKKLYSLSIILISIGMMISGVVNAQWTLQTNPLGSNDSTILGKIQFVSATEGWITCGANGSLLHTTNGGSTWNIVTPFPNDVVGNMSDPAISMSWVNPTHGWAIKTFGSMDNANGAVLYKTTDGGITWNKKAFANSMATVTYSTADLQGTWQWHSLVAANNNNLASWSGWIHGIINLNASGNGTFSNVVKSDGTTIGITSVFISISSGGVITVGGDSYGYMSADKSSVYLTMTDGGGGYTLGVMQKVASAITYNLTDLQGTWQMHSLTTSNPSSSNQYASWMHGTISMDASGNGTANFVDVNGSKSQNMILSISSDGIVTMNGKDFHGFMSENKKSISITMTDGGGGGYDLISMQKDISGTSYATADLQGKWQTHVLSTSNLSIISLNQQPGWSHGIITLKSNGEGKTNFVNNNGKHSDNDITLSISSNGLVTTSGKDMHGFMSADKSSILMTMTEDNGGYTLAVMQKDLSDSGDFGLQVQFVDENNGWASIYNMIYGNFQLYKTTDGGSTWNPIDNAVGGIYQFVDANNGWMEGATIGNIGEGNLNNIYHTTDGGSIWIQQASNIGKANALYFSDLLHGWVVGENGLVLKTTDGGSNWTAVTNASITSVSNSKSVFFLDANNGWITNEEPSWPNHAILHTTNGGNSWTHQDPNFLNGSMFNIFFWDKNNGWFTGEQNIQNGFSQNSENEFRGIISHFAQNDVNITAGGLATSLSDTEKNTITNLIITGTIDARDFKTMRDDMPMLASVDLSGTTVVTYTGTGGTYGSSSITFPANTIPQRAFYNTTNKTGKTSLISFIFPASVITIDSYAFYASGLTSITIPSTLTTIGYGGFYSCNDLKTITFESSSMLTTIGVYAFGWCSKLTSFEISASVTSIGDVAFLGTSALITVDINNPNFSNLDGALFNKDKTRLMYCPAMKTGSYEILSTVTTIAVDAFYNCYRLSSIKIPSSVTTLEDWAFENCFGLSSITIPSSVNTIKGYAFYNCWNLTTIYANAATPVNLSASDSVFNWVDKNKCVLYVPAGSKGLYQAASQWKDFFNIVEYSQEPIDLQSGLVAYYPFNGNANDESRNSNNATVLGPVLTQDKFGNMNNAYVFNGSNDYMTIDGIISDLYQNNTYTITGWFKTADTSSNMGVLFSLNRETEIVWGQNIAMLYWNVNNLTFYSDTIENNINYYYQLPLNEWHFFALTNDNTNLSKLFVENNILTQEFVNKMKITNISKSSFGQEWDNGESGGSHFSITSQHYNGSLDNIRIYNRILNQSEIEVLYSELQTGIQGISDNIIQLYPNPATDGFYMNEGDRTVMVSMYNLNGELIFSKQVNGKSYINIDTLAQGVYIVKIITAEDTMLKKLVKK